MQALLFYRQDSLYKIVSELGSSSNTLSYSAKNMWVEFYTLLGLHILFCSVQWAEHGFIKASLS